MRQHFYCASVAGQATVFVSCSQHVSLLANRERNSHHSPLVFEFEGEHSIDCVDSANSQRIGGDGDALVLERKCYELVFVSPLFPVAAASQLEFEEGTREALVPMAVATSQSCEEIRKS